MDFGTRRDLSEFYGQLTELRNKFQNWDTCEKTVALYYLMVGLPFANARFLQHALDQLVSTINTPDAQILEKNANDNNVIQSFLLENPQSALCLMLHHLPLLKPGNKDAAQCYLKTIKKILTEFISSPFKKIYNECVEIMSYVYIHPAFDKNDKISFKHLMEQVLSKVAPEYFVTECNDKCITSNADVFDQNDKKRSNSLTPGTAYISDIESLWSSQENLTQNFQKPRSFSLSCDKNTVSDASRIHSSLSETKLQEMVVTNNFPVMKSVLSWLKSLRLHKYSWIFNNLTTSQMLNLTEDHLIGAGVTKGARHKLLLSLEKLRNRKKTLSELEIGVMNGGDLYDALKELKGILQSPLEIPLEEDLSSQFVRVMGKVCTQLLMVRQQPDENLVLFNSMCEKVEVLECFTMEQKKKINMWKEQLTARNMFTACPQGTCCRKRNKGQQYLRNLPSFDVTKDSGMSSSSTCKSSSYPNMQTNSSAPAHRHSVDSITLKNQLLQISSKMSAHSECVSTTATKSGVASVKSDVSESSKNNFDIENSLESLCIQMMEHALGP